jgi:ribosomal protein S27AE
MTKRNVWKCDVCDSEITRRLVANVRIWVDFGPEYDSEKVKHSELEGFNPGPTTFLSVHNGRMLCLKCFKSEYPEDYKRAAKLAIEKTP